VHDLCWYAVGQIGALAPRGGAGPHRVDANYAACDHAVGQVSNLDRVADREIAVHLDHAGVLPNFTGVAVHDGFKPYRRYTNAQHALCNVHHLRELLGIIEPDGMRNGSTRNERSRNTNRITGKNARAYSTMSGSRHTLLTVASGSPAFCRASAARVRIGLFQELAQNRGLLVAAHLPFPSLGRVAADGDAFRWVPVIWDF